MVEYKVNVKLSDSQLNYLKHAVANQTLVTLRMNIKCLKETIYLMNYDWQQDKKLS